MKVAFCTTVKGRVQHMACTLPDNLHHNPDCLFIVLGYNDQWGLEEYIRTHHIRDIVQGRLLFYQYREQVPFRMAHAKNLAHRLALANGADILVNLDADNFTGPGFGDYVAEQFRGQPNIFLWSRMVKEGGGRLTRGISGRIVVTANAFRMAGGYDEKYETHSPDDKDFNDRLRRLGFDGLEVDPKYLSAISHNDKMRYREYPEAAKLSCDDWQLEGGPAVVNSGNVGCGTVYLNFTNEPVEVKPIPTRIFGIGAHKTATTSLHHALNTLGFRSGHWLTAHWAKTIWRDINELGRSPTLERFYALSDLPIPMLFRKLDKAYPGSKFILTTRNEAQWLDSVRRHFSYEGNRFRVQWDTDPFSHRIHQILYGRTDFDRETFLTRYRLHNDAVLEYFKDRPQDFLVMDMSNGAGWKELCGFLGVQTPSSPYPDKSSTL